MRAGLFAALAGLAAVNPNVAPQHQPVFSSEAELVVLHVSVTDGRGGYLSDLPREAFRVLEDGKPQDISFFTGEDSPVTVGLLVDSSGSMRYTRDRVIAAAAAFAAASNPQDEIFALAFNERVRAALPPETPFTSDAQVLAPAMSRVIGARGLTALYDAVSAGLSYIAAGKHPRRVLIVVADGGDNASTSTFDEVLRQAQASNAAIYAVGVTDPLEPATNRGVLRQLARATGGEAFFPRRASDVAEALDRIARDIRHAYSIGYVSTNSARDGAFRRVRVEVRPTDRQRLVVRTRSGYLARSADRAR